MGLVVLVLALIFGAKELQSVATSQNPLALAENAEGDSKLDVQWPVPLAVLPKTTQSAVGEAAPRAGNPPPKSRLVASPNTLSPGLKAAERSASSTHTLRVVRQHSPFTVSRVFHSRAPPHAA